MVVDAEDPQARLRFYPFAARRTPVLPLTSAPWGARSRQDRLDHRVDCCRRSYRPVSNCLAIGTISHGYWKSTPKRAKGLRYKAAMQKPDGRFVTVPLDWVEHLPEFRISKVGKLFSKYWSLPGQEQ